MGPVPVGANVNPLDRADRVTALLLSGPAGAGKSQAARALLAAAVAPTIVVDFQSLLAALLLLERGPGSGRYPVRDARQRALIPLVESTREHIVREALDREIDIIATNSNGDPARRATLLQRLGPGATERVIDPGRDAVTARLAIMGQLSDGCGQAIGRWYGRL